MKMQLNPNSHGFFQHCHMQHRLCRNHLIGFLLHQASPHCQINSWTRYIAGSMWILQTSCHQPVHITLLSQSHPLHDSSSSQDVSLYDIRKGKQQTQLIGSKPSLSMQLRCPPSIQKPQQIFQRISSPLSKRVSNMMVSTAWCAYDTHYRINAAASGNRKWAKLDTDLYTRFFTGRARELQVCSICDSSSHTAVSCPLKLRKQPLSEAGKPNFSFTWGDKRRKVWPADIWQHRPRIQIHIQQQVNMH